MFEGTLIESRGLVVPGTKRWTTLGSAVFQCALAALVVMFHLAHPEVMPIHLTPPQLVAPVTKPPIPQIRMEAASASASPAMSVATTSADPVAIVGHLFLHPTAIDADPPPTGFARLHMDGPAGLGMDGIGLSDVPSISVVPARPAGLVKVSSGVSTGMLLAPIRPVYPAIAKAAGVQGAVVMEAMISKAGRIESLHVVSGPPMLRAAALDAVQAARYQPYKLNGEATEVQTTITVNFRLGS